ncbi:MAG: tetratricopeptide repeat protein [Acidobacteria bacterium]|nr:tetratricopeptide repeat protein [Acidobacteriota bacterium]
MPFNREATLVKADKLLKQGRVDAAIAEYARVVEQQPSDWVSANTLGDLYLRVGQVDNAIAQFMAIADRCARQGFLPRAAALYKKILKVRPDDEATQLHLADVSARQGLLADAKGILISVIERRRSRGDKVGIDDLFARLGAVDPAEAKARRAAIPRAENDTKSAAQLREIAADLSRRGKTAEALTVLRQVVRLDPEDVTTRAEIARAELAKGDLEAAREYVSTEVGVEHPDLLLALAEAELRAGRYGDGRQLLTRALFVDESLRGPIAELSRVLARVDARASFVCVDAVVEACSSRDEWAEAVNLLRAYVADVPRQIPALLRLVEVCASGGLEAARYAAQEQLADAYLAAGRAAEARILAEDLALHDGIDPENISRLRRTFAMLGHADPDRAVQARLGAAVGAAGQTGKSAEAQVPAGPAEDEALRPVAGESMEVDLTPVLDDLAIDTDAAPEPIIIQPAEAPGETMPLDEVFAGFRDEVARQRSEEAAAQHYKLALAYREMGMVEETIKALRIAARSPHQRFESAALLGRLYRDQGFEIQALEWLERAAEAPAPSVEEGRALLYDLGDTLEKIGETTRALAIFLELEADAGHFRDVRERVERLSRVRSGG